MRTSAKRKITTEPQTGRKKRAPKRLSISKRLKKPVFAKDVFSKNSSNPNVKLALELLEKARVPMEKFEEAARTYARAYSLSSLEFVVFVGLFKGKCLFTIETHGQPYPHLHK